MYNDKQIQRKPRLTTSQIDYCLLHMLRVPELFEYAKKHLKSADFNPIGESIYHLLWSSALIAASRNDGKLPDKGFATVIAMEILTKQDNSHGQLSEQTVDNAITLLSWIDTYETDKLSPKSYKSLIQDLIIERTVIQDMTKEMALARDVGRPVDIVKSLDNYNKKLQLVLTNYAEIGEEAFPKHYKPKKLGKFSTGFRWLDEFMNGGQAPGEVYAMLGPTGLGKTSTGVGLAVQTARVWNSGYLSGAIPRRRISAFFSYEQDLERLRHRFWAFAAKVDSTRLEQYADEQITLSTTGNLAPYELVDFASEIKAYGGIDKFKGELERLDDATAELSEIVQIYDFSGAADNPHLGEGYIDEIVGVLQEIKRNGKDIGTVIIDYAGAAVKRHLFSKGVDVSNNIRHYLSNFCNECRSKIAVPYDCSVWVMHQLNTESNRRAPSAQQHHSFAAECGNFAENVWFAFVFGTKDKVNSLCQLHCTKERRAKGDRPPVILRIEGNYCRMVDVSDTYTLDPYSRSFMPKTITNTRFDNAELRRRAAENLPNSGNLGGY